MKIKKIILPLLCLSFCQAPDFATASKENLEETRLIRKKQEEEYKESLLQDMRRGFNLPELEKNIKEAEKSLKNDKKLLERFPENCNFKEKVTQGEKYVAELSAQIEALNASINKELAKEGNQPFNPSSDLKERTLILTGHSIDLEQNEEEKRVSVPEKTNLGVGLESLPIEILGQILRHYISDDCLPSFCEDIANLSVNKYFREILGNYSPKEFYIPTVGTLKYILEARPLHAVENLHLLTLTDLDTVIISNLCDSIRKNRSIKTLAFYNSPLTKECIDILVSNPTVTDLNLQGAGIGGQNSIKIAKAFTNLKALNLLNNQIEDKEAGALIEILLNNSSLETLNLGVNQIGKKIIDLFAHSTLTNLYLASNLIGDEGIKGFSKNSNLRILNLIQNQIGDSGAKILAQSLINGHPLTEVYLNNNKIEVEGSKALGESLVSNKNLKILDLGFNNIESEGGEAFAYGLAYNLTLTDLDLSANLLKDRGVIACAKALKSNSDLPIAYLKLRSNQMGVESAKELAAYLKNNRTLKLLDLGFNCIGNEGAQVLSEALTDHKTLTILDLSSNSIQEAGAETVSKNFLQNKSLTALTLNGNELIGKNKGKVCLQDFLSNSKLKTLSLQDNKIDNESIKECAKALTGNSTLTVLDLSGNSIKDEGVKELAKVLSSNSTLTKLFLRHNNIGNEGAKELANVLTSNAVLTQLFLNLNDIGKEGAVALVESLKQNTTLVTLDLMMNSQIEENEKEEIFNPSNPQVNKVILYN